MKIGIAHRLFFTILTATSLAILCIFLIMHWSINRGFMNYLDKLDQSRLEEMAARLEQLYAEHGSWDFLRDDPIRWIMPPPEMHGGRQAPHMTIGYDARWPAPPPPPQPEGAPGPRSPLIILDVDRKPVLGNPADVEDANFKPLTSSGKIIGYLGHVSPKNFLDKMQMEFLSRQKYVLILAAAGVVIVVGILSLPLAKRLVRPVRDMAAATHDVASGKYSVRVNVASSDELGLLARDFNEMALTLEKNEKERRQWIADISHELRTPLSVLRGEIEALTEGIRTVSPEAVRSLHAEVLRLHRLVDDLYQLALSDLGTMTYKKEELDPAEVLRDSVEHYKSEFDAKGIGIKFDIDDQKASALFADRERLHQLFDNLLENSLKYTDPGGYLLIRLEHSNEQAVIKFADSAPGVEPDQLGKLFNRLYRVEGSRNRSSGGAGLGLAICRNIVEAHAGTIEALPSPLGGVLIRIALPAQEGRA